MWEVRSALQRTDTHPEAVTAFGMTQGTREFSTASARMAQLCISSLFWTSPARHWRNSSTTLMSQPSSPHRTSGPGCRFGYVSTRTAAGVNISTEALLRTPSRTVTAGSSPLNTSSEMDSNTLNTSSLWAGESGTCQSWNRFVSISIQSATQLLLATSTHSTATLFLR